MVDSERLLARIQRLEELLTVLDGIREHVKVVDRERLWSALSELDDLREFCSAAGRLLENGA